MKPGMVKGMLTLRRVAAVFAFAVALVGGVAAFVMVRDAQDLEVRLSSVVAELSETRAALARKSDELEALRSENREYRDTFGRRDEVRKTLSDHIARLKDLALQIDEAKARLAELRTEAEARLAELKTEAEEQQTLPTSAPEEPAAVSSRTPLNELTCLLGGVVRIIRVEYSGSVGEPPCSVVYEKGPPEQPSVETLWRTNHEKGFCEARASEFVEKLRGWNWTCGPIGDVLGIPE